MGKIINKNFRIRNYETGISWQVLEQVPQARRAEIKEALGHLTRKTSSLQRWKTS